MSADGTVPGAKARLGEPGMVVDRRYRLDALIGSGGFGEVWRATQEVEGQEVRPIALKILAAPESAEGTPQTTGSDGDSSSWLNEVRAIREVSCEAITTIYDVGISSEPRIAYIAMELLEGSTLDGRLDGGPIYWRRALAIVRDVAAALEACHAVDVTHCDLKPPNIFVTAAGRVCVLDFGIAALGAEQAAANAPAPDFGDEFATGAVDLDEIPGAIAPDISFRLMGTPGYIAPEGYGGEPPAPAADVFALGVVLYEMISGRLPYNLAGDVPTPATATTRDDYQRYQAALNMATTRGDLVPLAEIADVPSAVSELVMRLMHLDPASRPTHGLRAAIDEVWQRPWGVPNPPYVGLEAFRPERTGFMAGRDADIREITEMLGHTRAVVLSGPSGCGKSSLAAAGVSARIDQELLDNLDGWRTVVLRPSSGSQVLATSSADPGLPPSVGTVVVIDQLEEVLTLDHEQRVQFCTALADLATASKTVQVGDLLIGPEHGARVVATIRDDLFGGVAALPELRRVPEQNLYTVRGVEPNAIREIVEGPARVAGFRLEDSDTAVAEATRVLAEDPSALPLVQFALTRWWEQRDTAAALLPAAAWTTIGGIEGALADAAEKVYDALPVSEREHMRALLIELFRADGTRVRVAEERVASDPESRRVLNQLIDRRLIRRQSDGDVHTLEVVHEALARRWHPLRAWLEETRSERELIQDGEYDADRWQRAGKPADMLWRGGRLAQALELAGRMGPAADFVAESERLAGAQRQRRRTLNIAAFAILVAFVIGLVFAYVKANSARELAEDRKSSAEQAETAAVTAAARAETARAQAEVEREKAERALADRDVARRQRDEVEAAREQAEQARTQAEEARKQADQERARAMDLAAKLTRQARELATERDKANRAESEATAAAAEATKQSERAKKAEAKAKKALRELQKSERDLQRLRDKNDDVGDLTYP